MCLFLCQYHAVLITVALLYSLKSGHMIPPVLFFFLKIALEIWGLLWFHINFRVICCNSEKYHEIFERDCIKSIDCFGHMDILTILILPISEQSYPCDGFPFLCIVLNFLHQCFIVFRDYVFCILG